jgi:hypothetical protein
MVSMMPRQLSIENKFGVCKVLSRPGAGWLWNFRLDDVGRWHDSELLSLGGQLDHNELGIQLEESTSRFQCKN